MKTKKLYYEEMFRKSCEAVIIGIKDNRIICDQTVAFPEGGGQIGDIGHIICEDGKDIPFVDTQKGYGNVIHLNDRYTIQINTPIFHIVSDNECLNESLIGQRVNINIDVNRRMRVTALHSALHLVLMSVTNLYSDLQYHIKGCHIGEDKARIDFFSEHKFSKEEVLKINGFSQQLINENLKIERFLYNNCSEAWMWKCKDFQCPCGGTHVLYTNQLGNIHVKRKNVGKFLERLIVTLENVKLKEDMYN